MWDYYVVVMYIDQVLSVSVTNIEINKVVLFVRLLLQKSHWNCTHVISYFRSYDSFLRYAPLFCGVYLTRRTVPHRGH